MVEAPGDTGIISCGSTFRRADGRKLGFAEYGDPHGFPVLAFHGVPGTRFMFKPTAGPARARALRIIAPDRPGFGLSEPQPGRVLSDWLDDVAALLKHTAVGRFSLVAISGGAPYATLTAAHFGDRVASLGLVSPMGPVADLGDEIDMPLLQRRFFTKLAQRERVVRFGIGGAKAIFRLAPEVSYDLMVRTLPEPDREILNDPVKKRHVIADVKESLTFDGDGTRTDYRIFSERWGVDYEMITAPSVLWQGLDDTIVPISAAMELGRRIPDCRIIELAGEGHFWGLQAIDEILDRIATLAKIGQS